MWSMRLNPAWHPLGLSVLCVALLTVSCQRNVGAPLARVRAPIATGPLRLNPANPRYFTDGSGKAIYLTGAHTWANGMEDRGTINPPPPFDYNGYINFMVSHNFNWMRLWTAEMARLSKSDDPYEDIIAPPFKWARSSICCANDGGSKFDFTQLDQNYFDRLRARVAQASQNGIYVSVMVFNGYMWQFDEIPTDGNPFEPPNNLNSIACGGNCPSDNARIPAAAWNFEQTYLRKVIDTVNDLPNVMYEVSNEAGSPYSDSWQASVINFIKQYEATKPFRHPVGMTFQWQGGSDSTLYTSAADWVSPVARLPAGDGRKLIINDTDHSYSWPDLKRGGKAAQRAWVWKNFTLGNNVAFMDPYLVSWPDRNSPRGSTSDPHIGARPDDYWDVIRDAMGSTLTYANRMNLVAMTPQSNLSSTGYCLASPGSEYLAYQASSGSFTVNLLAGTYQFEWLNPSTIRIALSGTFSATDGNHLFNPPFRGDALLYLRAVHAVSLAPTPQKGAPEGKIVRKTMSFGPSVVPIVL
jgi:hypothetical protein